jgi:two-component sensor histidine kinase
LFQSYVVNPATINLKVNVEEVFLDLDTAIPCGLIINELISNSLKYAFPPTAQRSMAQANEIRIDLQTDQKGRFNLTVRDNGVGLPEVLDPYQTETLGLQLVMRLTEQLKGQVQVDRDQGATFTITFTDKNVQ